MKAGLKGIAATVPARQQLGDCDYYLRSFRPNQESAEEHVSASLNRSLAPRWSKILQKRELVCRQISRRGGLTNIEIPCPGKVILKGRARTVLRSDILLESVTKSFA
jgi:predicted PhzF superfamily epimerase YddE/YHI9